MADEDYIICLKCGLCRYLKDHKAWDKKSCARKWIQYHCPEGLKKGCSTRLRGGEAVRNSFKRQKLYMRKGA